MVIGSASKLIGFNDHATKRNLIYDAALQAVNTRFPLENDQYILRVADVEIKDREKDYDTEEQKKAIVSKKHLTKKLVGKFELIDKTTGKVVSKSSKRTLMNVPYLTNRGTFIRNGTESVMMNQFRMSPGVYHRKTADGEFESFFNVAQGTGTQFKLRMDPKTAKFYFRAKGRKINAYPVLRELGTTDEELEKAWGKDILNRNKVTSSTRDLNAAYEVFVPQYIRKDVESNEQANTKTLVPSNDIPKDVNTVNNIINTEDDLDDKLDIIKDAE